MNDKDNEDWILSFYRFSEITGALFFGRLARVLPPGDIQRDMTKHFADESMHAWYWTSALDELGKKPVHIGDAYQDQYLESVGIPTNIMEILAITNVFECRVIAQYALHNRVPGLNPVIASAFDTIMTDEKWHIEWIGDALKSLEPKFGKEHIDATLDRYRKADKEIYGKIIVEHEERIEHILDVKKKKSV